MDFVYLKVKYGGNWVDCSYEGDRERDIPLSGNAMSMYSLRYHVSQYCSFLGSVFDVFYSKTTRSGRIVKSRLISDDQVV